MARGAPARPAHSGAAIRPGQNPARREPIYHLYLSRTARINNWDLVDCSAEHIVGAHLRDGARARLHRLARSRVLWERRIAIIATFHYIKRGDFADTLRIARLLRDDPHDLIHKAVGWMLREVGKRDRAARGEVPAAAREADAPDDAPLRHRAVPSIASPPGHHCPPAGLRLGL